MDETTWDPDHDWILQFEKLLQSEITENPKQGTVVHAEKLLRNSRMIINLKTGSVENVTRRFFGGHFKP